MSKFCPFYTRMLLLGLIMASSTMSETITSGLYIFTFSADKRLQDSAAINCSKNESRLVVLNDLKTTIIIDYLKKLSSDTPYLVHGKAKYCNAIFKFGRTTKVCYVRHFYICEKAQVNVTLSKYDVTVSDETTITCNASGYPVPAIGWQRNNIEVSDKPADKSVYQTKSSDKSILHLKDAKVTDEGKYECHGTNSYGGNTFASTKAANIKVPINPTIKSVKENYCNSSLVIEWKPHPRSFELKHKFIIREINSNEDTVAYSTTQTNVLQTISISITSGNQYDITIQPCLADNECYSYKASQTFVTGDIPSYVLNATLKRKENDICMVSWDSPHILSLDAVLRYHLRIKSYFAQPPPELAHVKLEDIEKFVDSSVSSYLIPRLPNRNHTVYIEAETCTGLGKATMASGNCVTYASASTYLPQPQLQGKTFHVANGTLQINFPPPDETNGMISCVFIIVYSKHHIEDGNTKKLLQELSAENPTLSFGYIAVAVKREYLQNYRSLQNNAEILVFILGDESQTECDIRNVGQDGQRTRVNDDDLSEVFRGHNKILKKDEQYQIQLITSTPSGLGVLFQVSEKLNMNEPPHSDNRNTQVDLCVIAFSVAGVILVTALITIIALLQKMSKMKQANNITTSKNDKRASEVESPIPHPYEYPEINIRENTAHYIKPEGKQSESEYEQVDHTASSSGQQSKAYENQDVDIHYELPQNPYELISK